jgi:ribose transport system permease protein
MALTSPNSKQLKSSLSFSHRLSEGPLLIICIYLVMAAIYIAVQPSAWSQSSIEALFNNSLPLMLAAAGATFVILHGDFDLSVAGVISLSNVVVATMPVSGIGGSAANLAVVIMIGLAVGAINGLFVAYLRIQAIAVTLATMIICKGAALLILRAPGGTVPEFMTNELTSSLYGIVPVAVVVAACVIVFWSIYSRTNTGLALIAIGQDGQAAALSGIDVAWVRFKSFLWAGVFYSLAGYMLAAQTTTGNPNAGNSFLLLCFASVALGGTAFGGGRGGLTASIIGAATLMLMQKVLFALGVSSFYTGVVQGAIMIMAVLVAPLVRAVAQRQRGAKDE